MTPAPVTAAQYLRMSNDNQRYSPRNQALAIERYADAHGYQIVRTYADRGKSGLTLRSRLGLQALLADALSPERPFSAVLVLDVSRWGRFQDLDQSAHYEFLCRQAGVEVIYCAEPFENDGSSAAAMIKELKRLMAAEYSRELSTKVAAAMRLQAKLGFRMGAPVIYGVERLIVGRNGRPRGVLERGEGKAQKSDRIVLQHGPKREIRTLRRIFRRFAVDGCTPSEIARELNREGVPFVGRRRWSRDGIVRLMRHELMVGIYIYDRRSTRLKGPLIHRDPAEWVRVKVFDPIVPPRLFQLAQERLGPIRSPQSRDQMLRSLQSALQRHGRLSATLIDALRETPCVNTYAKYFGSLRGAYEAIGHTASPPGPRPNRPTSSRSVSKGTDFQA